MMKQKWVRPQAMVQTFVANEYIAASCGDKEQKYYFICDATTRWGTGLTGYSVYTNGADGVQNTSDDVLLGSYGACSATHEAKTTDDFINGYMRKNVLGYPVGSSYPVIIWRGEDGNNIHCTSKINKNEWEVNKS